MGLAPAQRELVLAQLEQVLVRREMALAPVVLVVPVVPVRIPMAVQAVDSEAGPPEEGQLDVAGEGTINRRMLMRMMMDPKMQSNSKASSLPFLREQCSESNWTMGTKCCLIFQERCVNALFVSL